jgi:hypothetical protein
MKDDEKTKNTEVLGAPVKKDEKKLSSAVSNKKTQNLADEYMKRVSGKSLLHPKLTFNVSPQRGVKPAESYEQMKQEPNEPKARRAYDALLNETIDQWNQIKKTGLKMSAPTSDMEPSSSSGLKDVFKDIAESASFKEPKTNEFGGQEEAPLMPRQQMATTEPQKTSLLPSWMSSEEPTAGREKMADGGRVMLADGGDIYAEDPYSQQILQGGEALPSPTPQLATPTLGQDIYAEDPYSQQILKMEPPSGAPSLTAPQDDLSKAISLPTPSTAGQPKTPETAFTREYAPVWDMSGPTPTLTTVNHGDVTEAIRSGKYAFDRSATVPMRLPDGEIIPVGGDRVRDALSKGLSYATPQDVLEFKYGGAGQQAIAGVEALARGVFSAPVVSGIEMLAGVNPEDILGREEANPVTAMASETFGTVAPLVLSGGAWALEKAGAEALGAGLKGAAKLAAKAPLPLASNIAGEATSRGVMATAKALGIPAFLSYVPAQTARGALELGLYQAQNELSHYMLGADQTSDSILSAIGMSGFMGGLLGGGLGLAGQGYKFGKLLLGSKAAPEVPPFGLPDIMHQGRRPPRPPGGAGAAAIPEGAPERYTSEMLEELGISPPVRMLESEAPQNIPMPAGYGAPASEVSLHTQPSQISSGMSDIEQALAGGTETAPPVPPERSGVYMASLDEGRGGWVPPHLAEQVMDGDPVALAMLFPEQLLEPVFGETVRGMTRSQARTWVQRNLSKLGFAEKPEAPAIRAAIERVTDGQIPADKAPRTFLTNNRLYQLLSQTVEDTFAGVASPIPKQMKLMREKIEQKYLQLLGESASKLESQVEIGQVLRNAMTNPIEARYSILQKPYQRADAVLESIPLTEAEREGMVSTLQRMADKLKPSEASAKKALEEVIEEVRSPNVETVKDLRQSMKNFATKAFEADSGAIRNSMLEQGYTDGWKVLKDFENSIGENLLRDPRLSPEIRAAEDLDRIWPEKLKNDVAFGTFMEDAKFLAKKLGAAKGHLVDAPSVIRFLKSVSPDVVFKKIALGSITYNDMMKIATDFPDLAKVIRSAEKIKILQEADAVNDISKIPTIAKKLRKYSKEQRAFIFDSPEDIRLLEDLILISKNNPAHKNHSNTEVARMINNAITTGAMAMGPGGIAAAIATQAKVGVVANMVLKAADKVMQRAPGHGVRLSTPGQVPPFMPNIQKPPKKFAEGGMVTADTPQYSQQAFAQAVNQPSHIQEANRIVNAIVKSDKMITNSVKSIFDPKSAYKIAQPTPKGVERLKGYIKQINQNPEAALSIGSDITPEFNSGWSRSVASAASYIKSFEPKQPQALPFDSGTQAPPGVHTDVYNHVLKVTEQPLSILHKVKQGTLIPEEVGAVKTVYPDLYQRLSQQITDEMISAKAKGATIPYRTKLGLSAFLGSPLDSTMTPDAIQSAQIGGQGQQPGGAQMPPPQSSTKSLNKSITMAQTPMQARAFERSQGK